MSHIFDALQRSEAERSGVELDACDLPTELLQMTESSIAPRVNGSDQTQQVPEIEWVPGPEEVPSPEKVSADVFGTAVSPSEQFESLPVSLLPYGRLVTVTDKEGLAAEKFRFLAVRLRHLQQRRLLKRLLITSTVPEEGKSMVAGNLACALAGRRRQKILLMEGDLRRPTLRRLFGLDRVQGLTEYLQRSTDGSIPIYRLESVGIWIMPAGGPPHDSLELMQSPRLGQLMDRLNSRFDWMVIDSPPVLPLADTSVWARLADGILLVTRRGTTDREQLKRGLEALEPSKLLGALLNSSNAASHAEYYQHYRAATAASATPNLPEVGQQVPPTAL